MKNIKHLLDISHWEEGVDILLSALNPWLMAHWQTSLVAAQSEPFYKPAKDGGYHEIQFAHGYFNSVLHELAHWCVAGDKRRLLPDFGYWYEPDGRTAKQQQLFEAVEVKPQAIEWHFSQACCRQFSVSIDNLSGELTDASAFINAVTEQAQKYHNEGLPERADCIVKLLCNAFQQESAQFCFSEHV